MLLTRAPFTPRLRELCLSETRIGDVGAGALADGSILSGLRRLDLSSCQIGDRGARALAGSPHLERLKRLASELEVADKVEFLGRIPARQKHQEMANAHMLLLASVREGWGLVVTEANAFGTPAIAYNVPGLRDSIRHEDTGLLVDPTPQHLARAMFRLWQDPVLFSRLSEAARKWSATFTFDETASRFRDALLAAHARKGGHRPADVQVRG